MNRRHLLAGLLGLPGAALCAKALPVNQPAKSAQIVINGYPRWDRQDLEFMMEMLREAINERDLVFIDPNSLQGQVLR